MLFKLDRYQDAYIGFIVLRPNRVTAIGRTIFDPEKLSFVAAMSAAVFVIHAGTAGKTEVFCKEIISWQKPIYTFDSDYNKKLVEMGARPVNMDNVSLWANLFAAYNDSRCKKW